MNYQEVCKQVCDIAQQTGAFIAQERVSFRPEMVELKGRQDLVSYVDKEAERKIVASLQDILPQSTFITEEGTADDMVSDSEFCWIIDPLDGTTNFIHAMPPYCVSIALQQKNEIILGVVYEITRNECYYAWKGSKAYLNGNEIKVSTETKVENSMVVTGFSASIDRFEDRLNELFCYFNRNSHGIRRLGSAAADLVYVATGRAECFYHSNLSPWDVAAGAFIVQCAGGSVSDFTAGDNYIFGRQIIATNGVMHQTFLDVIRL